MAWMKPHVTTSTAHKKRPNQRARIRLAAVELLQQHPEGLTYTELVQAMRQLHPDRNLKSLSNDVVNLDRHFPSWAQPKGAMGCKLLIYLY